MLWSLGITPNNATGYTPFFLVHDAKAVLPAEVQHNAPRVVAYNEADSTAALEDDVDLLDKASDIAAAHSTVYQQNLRNYHSYRLRSMSLSEGDLVLRLKQKGHLKLESPWEGSYVIMEVIPSGTYRLKDLETGVAYSKP